MPNPLTVVDLSHHNPEPAWDKMIAGGVLGVIHKATEGSSYVDDTFAARRERAKSIGLPFASYHFLKHGEARGQMMHYLDVVGPVAGERVVIDYEDTACTLDDLWEAVEALAQQPVNLQITVYSGNLIKQQLGNDKDVLLADYTSLWIAQYTPAASPSWPTGTWPVWSLWQYTDKAQVPGLNQPVDGNRFNGSNEACVKWLGPASQPKPPATLPVVKLALTVPPNVDVEVSVNGETLQ